MDDKEDNREWTESDRDPPSIWRRLKWKLHDLWVDIKSIPHWIVRVAQNSILLWHDRDWHYIFLLYMMQFKIKRMRKHMVKHNILLHTNMHAKQMKYAEFLIDRITTNDYCKKEYEALDKKWGR